MNYNNKLEYALKAMKNAGADKAQCELIVSEKHELNTQAGEINLFRTNVNTTLKLKYIKNQQQGTLTLNKIDDLAIDEGVKQLQLITDASPVDDAYDIADKLEGEFMIGILEPDLDKIYNSLKEFASEMKDQYSKIAGDAILSFDLKNRFLSNTNGLNLTENNGSYNFQIEFTAKDGEKITSFNYTIVSMTDLKKKLMETGSIRTLLDQSVLELESQPLGDKFVGDIIITPDCLLELLRGYEDIALKDAPIIGQKSKLLNKINKSVASEKLSWYSNPRTVSVGECITIDGFEAKDMPIIEKGVLKNFMLTQYGANKSNLSRSNNYGNYHVISPGEKSLSEIIKNVDKGILFCRFSGGHPSSDGSFSGVAKNSFYIENGKIVRPISETMVSGNLFSLFNDIKAISSETVDAGNTSLPWIHSTGTTISG
ncbi:metallopeptidase TldD-related protein [Clostridiaceae bacterium M8S5]|nr:metallopeptidase TldD-related protein [Clostridiaceae bacterium M8S5]